MEAIKFFKIYSAIFVIVTTFNILFLNHFLWIFVLPTFAVISWIGAYFVYDFFNTETIDPSDKIVLITGCDTGFGNATAKCLDQYGFIVYAGVLNAQSNESKELKNACSKRLNICQMDVTNVDEVNNVIEQIKSHNKPLWAIINNAGIAFSCPFDWGKDISHFDKTLSVNLFGSIRVTKCSINLLRKSNGRIVNIGSMAGRISLPWMSSYNASKHALRAFNDTIRRELHHDNVSVVLIEPTFYRTQITNTENIKKSALKLYEESSEETKQIYEETMNKFKKPTQDTYESNDDCDHVVQTIKRATVLKYPKLYYKCAPIYKIFLVYSISHIPEIIMDTFMSISSKLSGFFPKKRS